MSKEYPGGLGRVGSRRMPRFSHEKTMIPYNSSSTE
jgi:hypothetical protein